MIAFVLAFGAGGGESTTETLVLLLKAITFIVLSLAASRWFARPIERLLNRLARPSSSCSRPSRS